MRCDDGRCGQRLSWLPHSQTRGPSAPSRAAVCWVWKFQLDWGVVIKAAGRAKDPLFTLQPYPNDRHALVSRQYTPTFLDSYRTAPDQGRALECLLVTYVLYLFIPFFGFTGI